MPCAAFDGLLHKAALWRCGLMAFGLAALRENPVITLSRNNNGLGSRHTSTHAVTGEEGSGTLHITDLF